MGVEFDVRILTTVRYPGILLLRTYAIYSGSRRVIFPLSITYAVRPSVPSTISRVGWDSLYVQGATVTGIFVTWSSLRKPTCEYFPGSNGRCVLDLWDSISRPATERLVQGVLPRAEGWVDVLYYIDASRPGTR